MPDCRSGDVGSIPARVVLKQCEVTMKTIEIKSTKDYTMFKLSPRNRTPVRVHINELKNAIKKENLLHLHPIVINDQREIISGQHRFLAAKELNLPIYYVQEEVSDDFIVKANLFQRQAKMEDSIKYYMNVNRNSDYAYLYELKESLHISIGGIMGLFGKSHDSGYAKEINIGEFKLKEPREFYEDIIGKYSILLDKIKQYPLELPSTLKSKNFCRAFNQFYMTKPNWELFFHRLHVDWHLLDKVYPLSSYWLEALCRVYEKHSRRKRITDE